MLMYINIIYLIKCRIVKFVSEINSPILVKYVKLPMSPKQPSIIGMQL